MRRRTRRLLRHAAALLLAATIAAPELALAEVIAPPRPLDAMSPAELDRYVQQINESANWRKYRRPNDPPDFVPGKPVRVMFGAGAAFGRGGGGNARNFRRSGLGQRRTGIGNRRSGGRDEQTAMDRGRGSSRGSSFGSGSSRSGSNRSSLGSRSSFGNSGGFNE